MGGKVVFGIVFCAGYVSKGPVDCEIARPIGRKCEPPFRSSEDTLTLGSCNFPGTGGCREAYLLMFKGLWSSGSRLPYVMAALLTVSMPLGSSVKGRSG